MKSLLYSLIISISITMMVNSEILANGSNSPQPLSPLVTNNWLGNTSSNWGTASNWSLGHLPLASEDVVINTGYTYYPIISSGIAQCNHFTLGTGARISLGNGDLEIGGNMTIAGQVDETHANADFMITGNVYWNAGSTANIANGEFHVEGHWFFNAGANAGFQYGTVFFTGSGIQYIYSKSAGCFFRHLTNDKTGGELRLDESSTDSLKINGNLRNNTSASILRMESWLPVLLKGQFVNNGHIYYTRGTLILNGTTHSINLNTGDWLFNLVIKSTGATSLSDSLRIHGDLTISSGTLAPGSWPILINGNWTNNVGPAAFEEGIGKVVFKGPANQFIFCSEDFNILELNLGGDLKINHASYTVTCNQYLWTSGGLSVQPGTFTAHNLLQEGIFGNFWLYTGGTINLTNDDIVDLNGYLHISGGNFNVVGLPGDSSYWAPYLAAGIFMTNGVLDFQNVGIKLPADAEPFTANISGGTIKCAGDLLIQKSGFNPNSGTFEFTGPQPGRILVQDGSNLHHVTINKPSGTEMTLPGNSIKINGNFSILSGKVLAGSCDAYIEGTWQNSVGSDGFDAGVGKVIFSGTLPKSIIGTETFYNLRVNNTGANSYGRLRLTNDITVLNDLYINDGFIEMQSPADLWIGGGLTIESGAGLNAGDSYGAHIMIGQEWKNYNAAAVTSTSGFTSQNSTVTFFGSGTQFLTKSVTEEVFYHLNIDKSSASFRSNQGIIIAGDLHIINGTWEDNVSGLTHQLYGNFTLSTGGIFSSANNTLQFIGQSNTFITNNSPSSQFANFFINKSSNASVTQAGTITLGIPGYSGNLTIQQGRYLINGNTLCVSGDVILNNSGLLRLSQPASTLLMTGLSKTISINNGGKLELIGLAGSPAVISEGTSANYQLVVNSGGIISSENAIFSGLSANGIQVNAGATVDPARPFTGCTFSGVTLNGTLLTLNNSQDLTIHNAFFPSNLHGAAYNVAKTVDSGNIRFIESSGPFSGETFENDPNNRIQWIEPLVATATATPSSVCQGGASQLTCVVAGGVPPFTWNWSPASGLSSSTISNPMATPSNTKQYNVTVVDAIGNTATSSAVITVIPNSTVGVTIEASATTVCQGSSVEFSATPMNGGTSPLYQWKKNNVNITGATASAYSYIPVSDDAISCQLTSNQTGCLLGNPATSNVLHIHVEPVYAVSAHINVTPSSNICSGATATFTCISGMGGITPSFQWKKGGIDINGATASIFTYIPLNGDVITCLVTSSSTGCISGNPALSNAIAMTVNPLQPVSVSVAATDTAICQGVYVHFYATATNGGTMPSFQWKKNGLDIPGANSSHYFYKPFHGDVITCELISSLGGCISGNPAISNSIMMTVNPVQWVSVYIAPDAYAVTPGTKVVFTAFPQNGGTAPEYLWRVNGWAFYDSVFSTFSYIPSNGDNIDCRLVSNVTGCVNNNVAWSNTFTMAVLNANTTVSGTIPEGNQECYSAFNTITVGGAGTPFTVQSGGSATMIAGQKIRYLPGTKVFAGGYLRGYITPDNTYCGNFPPMMASVQTGNTELETQPAPTSQFTIFPNPAREKFTLMYKGELTEEPIMVEILDMQGTTIMRDQMTGERTKQFRLGDNPVGLYLVKVNINNQYESLKLILIK